MSIYSARVDQGLCGSCGKEPLIPGRKQGELCAAKSRVKTAAVRQKAVAAGLCVYSGCDRPPVPGRTRCQVHLDAATNNTLRRQKQWQLAGLCYSCGKCPPKPGCISCQECITVHSAVASRRYAEKKTLQGDP